MFFVFFCKPGHGILYNQYIIEGYGDLAQRNPKLLFFTSGVKKLRLNVGALNPQP
jgi:hypothetical protein